MFEEDTIKFLIADLQSVFLSYTVASIVCQLRRARNKTAITRPAKCIRSLFRLLLWAMNWSLFEQALNEKQALHHHLSHVVN